MEIKKEDYEEPSCLLKMGKCDIPVHHIPLGRVLQKIDEAFAVNDPKEAERLILFWINEAKAGNDTDGEFSLRNELMGLYRKLRREEEAIENAKIALDLALLYGDSNNEARATCYVNSATVYKAFDKSDIAMPLFEKAKEIYESEERLSPKKLASLYNNMSLALVDLKRFDEAKEYYMKALSVLGDVPGSQPEQAITFLNMANMVEAKDGLEEGEKEIRNLCETAWQLLNNEEIEKNGNYAFVCDKCSSTFGYYGYFGYEDLLIQRAKEIYSRG